MFNTFYFILFRVVSFRFVSFLFRFCFVSFLFRFCFVSVSVSFRFRFVSFLLLFLNYFCFDPLTDMEFRLSFTAGSVNGESSALPGKPTKFPTAPSQPGVIVGGKFQM